MGRKPKVTKVIVRPLPGDIAGLACKKDNTIELDPNIITERERLRVTVHEALHLGDWKAPEKKVDRIDINAGVTWAFRGFGDSAYDYATKRYQADGGFIYFRGDISKTRDLTSGFQWFAKIQGQASSQPLINAEQFSAGGLGTVRGYLESETVGDNAIFGTFEFRSPSLLGDGWGENDDLRVYAFVEGGVTSIHDALPAQSSGEQLGSVGIGTRGRLFDHLNGSLDAAYPIFDRPTGLEQDMMYTFRLWGDF
jgi:hemolysin activation/secretion protein